MRCTSKVGRACGLAIAAGVLGGTIGWQVDVSTGGGADVAYPEGYREWVHVKSAFVGPNHAGYAENGGFHHIYANPEALRGYRTRQFPDGSIIVFDWLEMRDGERIFQEGPRRRIDVMLKDAKRFADTGGWGFERFAGDSRTERPAAPPRGACFDCHRRLSKDDLVVSAFRN